jgi:MFS family permease
MWKVLRVRDFRLLWSARLVSLLGSWLLVIAVPAHVLHVTGSTLAAGLTLAAEYLPQVVLGPFAGVLADRWDRRRLMLATDLFRAAALSAVLLAPTALRRERGHIAVPARCARSHARRRGHWSAAEQCERAERADRRHRAPDRRPSRRRAVRARRGSIGGTGRRSSRAVGDRVDLAAGLRFVRSHRIARALLVIITTFFAANACLSALLVPFGLEHLGGSTQIGFLLSALGVGFLLGAPLGRLLVDHVGLRHLLVAGHIATAGAFLLLFNAPSLVAGALVGVFGSTTLIAPRTALQRITPNAVLGHVLLPSGTVGRSWEHPRRADDESGGRAAGRAGRPGVR